MVSTFNVVKNLHFTNKAVPFWSSPMRTGKTYADLTSPWHSHKRIHGASTTRWWSTPCKYVIVNHTTAFCAHERCLEGGVFGYIRGNAILMFTPKEAPTRSFGFGVFVLCFRRAEFALYDGIQCIRTRSNRSKTRTTLLPPRKTRRFWSRAFDVAQKILPSSDLDENEIQSRHAISVVVGVAVIVST